MKTLRSILTVAALTAVISAFAADKEVTVSGEGKCAKCALKKADSCQNVIEVKNGDSSKIYYLTGDVSKAFHKNLCSGSSSVKATGVVTEKDGKMELAVSKIEKTEK